MIDIDVERLRCIGLTQTTLNELFSLDQAHIEGSMLMRVTTIQRDRLLVHDGRGEHVARVRPRLLQTLELEGASLAVGDWMLAEIEDVDERWLVRRLEPATLIARRANDGRRQTLASNVDTALLVMGLDHDFNMRRMERYIALVQASGVAPVAVLTKADIGTDVTARVAQLQHRLPASIPVCALNALDDACRMELAPWMGPGQTLVLLGASGTGKSTLTNTLTAGAAQATGSVRKGDGRGQHTTTSRSLHLCGDGACIIDTPGLRTWRPDADDMSLAATFDDIDLLADQCQFRNCRHDDEPGCAVRAQVDADRLKNYHKLLRDAQRGRQTPQERIAQRAKWRTLRKAGTERARDKRRI
jgi:ribosome biogenesis GTPase / thiamine phosphate phosphatase